MGYPKLVQLGTRLVPTMLKAGLPIKGIIRNTIFKQFVGGENLLDTQKTIDLLFRYGTLTILLSIYFMTFL